MRQRLILIAVIAAAIVAFTLSTLLLAATGRA